MCLEGWYISIIMNKHELPKCFSNTCILHVLKPFRIESSLQAIIKKYMHGT